MTPTKRISREPDNQMMNRGADLYRELTHKLATTRSNQQIVKELFEIMHDAAPDIETEAEKNALAVVHTWDTSEFAGSLLHPHALIEIIRALLKERHE